MSAFMVDEEHINVMVWAAVELARPDFSGPVFTYRTGYNTETITLDATEPSTLTRAGQMLVNANAASIRARYDAEEGYAYKYSRPKRTDWTPVDVLGALACYEYQACETGAFEDSEAGRFCQTLRDRLISRLRDTHDAPWEIRPDSAPAHAA